MEDTQVQTLTLAANSSYEVAMRRADGESSPVGEDLNGLLLSIVSGDGAAVEDNDTADALSRLVTGAPGSTFRVRGEVSIDGAVFEALADVTLAGEGEPRDDFVLVFRPV